MRSAVSCFSKGSGAQSAQPQQHKQFWLIWRPGTASVSKGFFLYSNNTVRLFFRKLRPTANFRGGEGWRFPGEIPPKTCLAETLLLIYATHTHTHTPKYSTCGVRRSRSSSITCGPQTARTWIQSIALFVVPFNRWSINVDNLRQSTSWSRQFTEWGKLLERFIDGAIGQ